MATPLTVCIVVLGKHVPGLEFIGLLMADAPPLAPDYGYYQRLLARDQSEAADLIDKHVRTEPPRTVYDTLILPALNYAERDRIEGRLSPVEEAAVIEATRELLSEAAEAVSGSSQVPASPEAGDEPSVSPREPLRVMGYVANGVADELALTMLVHVLQDLPITVDITTARFQASEMVAFVKAGRFSVVCIADLPPSPPSKTRYLVKRLHAALPETRIVVGRWGPAALADDSAAGLREAGASCVASTLMETRTYLGGLEEIPRLLPAEPLLVTV
jgi:hypothetical protein